MKHILLLGGGHAHTQVVETLAGRVSGEARVTLVAASANLLYSGMMPGLIAGHYRVEQCGIAVDALCERHGVQFLEHRAVGLDAARRRVRLANGTSLGYDLLSLNLGSTPYMGSVTGETGRIIPVKPFETFLARWAEVQAHPPQPPWNLVVVGGGAAGVEVALAVRHALRQGGQRLGAVILTLVDASDQVVATLGYAARRKVARMLAAEGIHLRLGVRVTKVLPDAVVLADGQSVPADHVIWASGAAPEGWLVHSGLTADTRGFVAVNGHLQSLSHPEVFAAGDTATLVAAPHPKAGVYAVRHGPVLADNLQRALRGQPLSTYHPQRRMLALISGGRRFAVASWGPLAAEGEWVWRWKDRIDREFIVRHQAVSGLPRAVASPQD